MELLARLSFRNLLRQKRRNLFLGIGIAFGMMILVIASSFSAGLMDVLVNDIVTNAYGHLVLEGISGNSPVRIIRDYPRMEQIIRETVKKEDLKYDVNEKLGGLVRAIGNGEADNVYIVGFTPKTAEAKARWIKYFIQARGDFNEYFSKKIENPVIISEAIAQSLNVKLHDLIRVRLQTVSGQIQAAQLTVVAIVRSGNTLMDMAVYLDVDRMKNLLGYKPWESGSLQFTFNNPIRDAKKYAQLLYQKLQPDILAIEGKANLEPSRILAFKNDDKSTELVRQKIRLVGGDMGKALLKDGVLVPVELAQKLNLQPGQEFTFQYETKYQGSHEEKFKVAAIYRSELGPNTILMNGAGIYDIYNRFLPKHTKRQPVSKENALYSGLTTEWELLPRSADSEELQNKYQKERMVSTRQAKFDVVTMYEGASDVLKLEGVLNLVTFIAVLVLFFIILIGVINTLRMTIRERTHEIGTVRAIGMQKGDVRNMFILETLFLTGISCVVGMVLGIIIMQILGAIQFDVNNALSMILKDRHLFFKLDPGSILFNFIFILFIAGFTSYFPARYAARISTVEALRYYE